VRRTEITKKKKKNNEIEEKWRTGMKIGGTEKTLCP